MSFAPCKSSKALQIYSRGENASCCGIVATGRAGSWNGTDHSDTGNDTILLLLGARKQLTTDLSKQLSNQLISNHIGENRSSLMQACFVQPFLSIIANFFTIAPLQPPPGSSASVVAAAAAAAAAASGTPQSLKLTYPETLDRIKEEFQFLQTQYHRTDDRTDKLKIEQNKYLMDVDTKD
ncbi:hypothetical protein F2P81_005749 [Scophthalmus maximus]|uniref:Groucho/TLE N-terminal Q-rich domain-containing protein n=1 Tax=Scophthalmus maximus TaxID=52904 RepID=A0A6A4T7E6_SCOMX|nr:hypothetical protein F2P81_005749 [Scophthalmus maximus]